MYKRIIVGNVVREPELRTTSSGQKMINVSIAVSVAAKAKQYETMYVNCVGFEKHIPIVEKLRKGNKVCIIGNATLPYVFRDRNGNPGCTEQTLIESVEWLPATKDEASQSRYRARNAPEGGTAAEAERYTPAEPDQPEYKSGEIAQSGDGDAPYYTGDIIPL